MFRSSIPIPRMIAAAGLAAIVVAVSALGGPAAGAQPARPFNGSTFNAAPISALTVQAMGTEATVSFTTAQPTAVTIDYKPVTAAAAVGSTDRPLLNGPGAVAPTPKPTPTPAVPFVIGQIHRTYATAHDLKLTGLTSNTPYDVAVTAETQSGQRLSARTRFTTLKQRIRVTLREINITEDGDWFGDGEPQWHVRTTWAGGEAGACYPNNGAFCEYGSHGEGRFFPRNHHGQPLVWLFAAENFDALPDSLTIHASVEEYDIVGGPSLGGFCARDGESADWQLPQAREWSSTPVTLETCADGHGFDATLSFTVETFHDNLSYPSDRNAPSSTW